MNSIIQFVTKYLSKSISWAFVLAFTLASLYYFQLIRVADTIELEKQKKEQVKADSIASTLEKQGKERTDIIQATGNDGKTIENDSTARSSSIIEDLKADSLYREHVTNILKIDPQHSQIKWYHILGLFVLFFWVFIAYRRRRILTISSRDIDPPELDNLFEKFSKDITSLPTPRNVKRLTNKLRFQYNLLEEDELLRDSLDRRFLFKASIDAEHKHGIFKNEESFKNYSENFYQKSNVNEQLVNKIYQLNMNVYGGED